MEIDFRYEAVNSVGTTVAGVIRAQSEQEALMQLRVQSLTPITLRAGTAPSARTGSGIRRQRASAMDKVLVIRELATLLKAGIPLVDAVHSVAQARSGTVMGEGFMHSWRALNAGQSFSVALAESKLTFPAYVSQLAVTGEMTGKLAATMADAARQMEYDDKVRQEFINALIYPAILVSAGLAAILLIFIVVVPKFANLIKGSRAADVPDISLWVINAGVFFKANWWLFAIASAIGVVVLIATLRTEAGRTNWLVRLSSLPVLGVWLREAEIGRWATTLATLLGNRVPILSALELSAAGLRLPQLRHELSSVIRDVRGGATVAESVAKYGVVDTTGVNLIRVGEKSGELPQMVATLGELHADAGRNRMKRFLTLLEPIAILLIGAVIGFIMVAIMMAITSMNNIRV